MGSFFYGVLIPNLVCELCSRIYMHFQQKKFKCFEDSIR